MKNPLSRNELEILDRQVAAISYQLAEISHLLESRLGTHTELATQAKAAQNEFTNLARRIHQQAELARAQPLPESQAHSA
jgi:hypothetical protein